MKAVVEHFIYPSETQWSAQKVKCDLNMQILISQTKLELLLQNIHISKVVIEWLILLLRIREVPGSNLGPEAEFSEVFRGFSRSLRANCGIAP
jgi:hypothetical protein